MDQWYNQMIKSPWLALPEPVYGNLTFKRAFWVVASAIAAIQVVEITLIIFHGFDTYEQSNDYHLHSALIGLAWYLLATILILTDMSTKRVRIGEALGIDLKVLKEARPQLIRYFGVAALTMITLSIILPMNDTLPQTDSNLITVLLVLSIVIAAPVCEEIWFRGYLYPAMLGHFKRTKERVVVNAMLFAAGHVFLLYFLIGAGVPYYIFIVGYLLAKLYETHRSILPCIILHFLNNLLAVILDVIEPHTLLGLYQ